MKDFLHEDKVSTKLTYVQLFKRLSPYFKKYSFQLLFVVCMVILMAVISRLIPSLIGYTIDHALIKKDYELLLKLLAGYIALQVLNSVLDFSQVYLFQRLGAQVLFDLRDDLISKIQSYPIDYFNKNPIGRIVTRATNDVAQIGELFSDGVVNIFVQMMILISIVVALVMISPLIAVITLASFPLFLYLALKVSDKIKITLSDSKKKLSELNSFVAENLNGIKIVQLYNRIKINRSQFANLSKDYKELSLKSTRNYALMMPILNLLNAVAISTAFYFLSELGIKAGLAIGTIVAFFLHVLDIIHPFREIIEKYQQFQNSLTSAERVFTMLDEPSEANTDEPDFQWKSGEFSAEIEFKNLVFSYDEKLGLVLKNINLKINPLESVAIVGRTGSGKSTLISLLQGFYPAPENSLFLSQTPIEQIPKTVLRNKIAVVQQDNFIFRGNIWKNISLEAEHISYEKVEKVARELGIVNHLVATNRNLYSEVEEKGANLSAGERQLIAFARILVFEPEIIILDEATSNIDSKTEKLIQVATEKIMANRTSIIIAHRLSTIRNCKKIVVIQQGQIVEEGSHQTLMQQSTYYKEMVEKYNNIEGMDL